MQLTEPRLIGIALAHEARVERIARRHRAEIGAQPLLVMLHPLDLPCTLSRALA